MRNEGVAIGRPFPPMYDWARISTGSIEEVNAFARQSRGFMHENKPLVRAQCR